MRIGIAIVVFSVTGSAQSTTFEIASVKASPRSVGRDYNDQLTISPSRLVGRNVTLRRLVAEAHGVQMNQVAGPSWLDQNEYEIDARAEAEVSRDRLRSMLLTLLVERFHLRQHQEQRMMGAYELVIDKGGTKISPTKSGAASLEADSPRRMGSTASNGGFPFHGGMRQLADLIAVQLTIPAPADPTRPAFAAGPPPVVLDKTGLEGVYDFAVAMRPEPGDDIFTLWQRYAQERLGLRLERTRGLVTIMVVDSAERIPDPN